MGDNANRNITNIKDNEETNTTLPFSPEEDYLLTLNPLQYSVLFNLRQELDNSRFFVNVNAVEGSLSETLYVIAIQNRTVLFHSNNSIFGFFKLANVSLWQKLVVSFNHREVSVTQECAEFSYLSLPSKPKLEEWEKITVTVHTENPQGDIQVCVQCVCQSALPKCAVTQQFCHLADYFVSVLTGSLLTGFYNGVTGRLPPKGVPFSGWRYIKG